MAKASPKALFEAALGCKLKQVKKLLADGADPNAPYDDMTPLFAVCSRGLPDVAVINALLDAGADPNTGAPNLPLFQAIYNFSDEGVAALIKAGGDVNVRGRNGETPLMAAARDSHEIAKLLLDAGADPNARDDSGRTALFYAMERHNTRCVELLRSVTEQTDSSERPWRARDTELTMEERFHAAAEHGDAEFVSAMLAEGVDINAVSEEEDTALHKAAENGHAEVVKLLLAHGADVEALDSTDSTPLISAALGGSTEVVRLLLEAGADAKASASGTNALHRCVDDGNLELIQLLIDAGADVNQKEEAFGYTPLHTAVENGRRSGHDNIAAVVKMLIAAGAKLDVVNRKSDGYTPLHRAATGADLATVKVLVEAGADYKKKDREGRTAADIARAWGEPAVADYLESVEKVKG